MRDIWEESDDHGMCRFAMVQTYGDTTHTFIERQNYKGIFLPGYQKPRQKVECEKNTSVRSKGSENHSIFCRRTTSWPSCRPGASCTSTTSSATSRI